MRLYYLFLFGILVALFLLARKWFDEKKEDLFDMEVVRQDEEHLGQWAGRSAKAFILFRLKRDNSFTGKYVLGEQTDTVRISGKYDIIGGSNTAYYPRLVAVGQNGDTLLNFFIAYVTPYDSKVSKVDKMVLNPNSIYDTISYVFYRVK